MIGLETILMIGLGISFLIHIISLFQVFALNKRIGHMHTTGRALKDLGADIAGVKREQNMLNDNFQRFRTQSLAGIGETINHTIRESAADFLRDDIERAVAKSVDAQIHNIDRATSSNAYQQPVIDKDEIKDSIRIDLAREVKGELEILGREFDNALTMVVTKVNELDGRTAGGALPHDTEQKISALAEDLVQIKDEHQSLLKTYQASPQTKGADLEEFNRAIAIDRFLISLDNPRDRVRCLLSSIDTVKDPATLGKLAVAYPSDNSWLILRELAENSIVSEVGGWSLLCGAVLKLTHASTRKERRLGYELLQSARQSFQSIPAGHHDGLYCAVSRLSKIEHENKNDAVSQLLHEQAQNHIKYMKNQKPSELGSACMQLADFYIGDKRFEPASVLLSFLLELSCEVFPDQSEGLRSLWRKFALCLWEMYKLEGSDSRFDFIDDNLLQLMRSAIADGALHLSGEEEENILLALMIVSSRRDKGDEFKQACRTLLDLKSDVPAIEPSLKSMARDKFVRIMTVIANHLADKNLGADAEYLDLSTKLVDRFAKIEDFSRAAAIGVRVVDAMLATRGESQDTIDALNNLASIYRSLERYDLAEECYKRVLEMQYTVYQNENEKMVEVLLNLAQVCLQLNNAGEAEVFVESAIEMANTIEFNNADQDNGHGKEQLLNRANELKGELQLA